MLEIYLSREGLNFTTRRRSPTTMDQTVRGRRAARHAQPFRRLPTASVLGRLAVALALGCGAHSLAQPTLSGRVTNARTGLGMVGIDLDVFDAQGLPVAAAGDVSGADGTYQITLPRAGSYFVRADPSAQDFFVDQYYRNVFLRAEATLLTVGAAEAVGEVNFALQTGFQIRGVVRSQGVAVTNLDLDLYAASGEFLSGYPAQSQGDGSFAFGALPPGSYYLKADPLTSLDQFYVSSYYGGAFELTQATPLVISNLDVTGLGFELSPGGSIEGRVADSATGAPLAGFDLDLYDTNGVRQPFNARTDAAGNYVVGPLPAGHYRLRVDPTVQQGYARTYFGNTFFPPLAQAIAVTTGRATAGVDFALIPAGAVTGHILDTNSLAPIPAIDLDIYDRATNRFDLTAKSDVNGQYLLGPLPAGSYIVRAQPGPTGGYLVQYYNRATNFGGATPVVIAAGQITSNIDFQLPPAGWIEGVVSNSSGERLAGIDLDLYEAVTGERLALGALTGTDGAYRLGPIPPGTYKLRCDPTIVQGYAVEYFNGRLTKAVADSIAVQASAGASNVNFTLDPGGSLSGRVVAGDTGQPVAALDIDVLQTGTLLRLDQSTKTDAAGQFSLGPLPLGSYLLRADPLSAANYGRTYYGGTGTPATAQTVLLSAAGEVGNLNIQLILKQAPPSITAQPASLTVTQGQSVTFSVTAGGTTPLSYQWHKDGTAILEATSASYTIAVVQTSHAGNYTVLVTNVAGSVTSAVATLTVVELGQPPPPLLVISRLDSTTLRLAVAAAPDRIYQLEVRNSLSESAWAPSGPEVTNSVETVRWDLPVEAVQRFYRVSVR